LLGALAAVSGLAVLGWVATGPAAGYVKAMLFVGEMFPQAPIRPLEWISGEPRVERIELPSPNGPIVVELFTPTPRFPALAPARRPVIIIAMGVRTSEDDRPIMLRFATTLSRLGYIVAWPRLAPLDRGEAQLERPETFATTFRYLECLEGVDPERISFAGFSIGSSIALVAATDPTIADRVNALVFFAGFYEVFDYLEAIARGVSRDGERVESWNGETAVGHTRDVLRNMGATAALQLFEDGADARAVLDGLPAVERAGLAAISPSTVITGLKAPIVILHDRNDHLVHYFESEKLYRALEGRGEAQLLIVDLFEHVQPRAGLDLATLAEIGRLFGLLASTFARL
jgi:acetyl esterase/lipase